MRPTNRVSDDGYCVVTVHSHSSGQVALRSIAAAVGGVKGVRDVGGVAMDRNATRQQGVK